MKNNVGIIILIILLSIITICLIAFLVLCLNGNFSFVRFNGFRNSSKNVIFEETYKLEGTKNIEIESDTSDIKVNTSDNNEIKVIINGREDDKVEVTNVEGKLKINYPIKNKVIIGFGFNVRNSEITVYVPKNYSEQINVKNNYGNCKVEDFEKATINIDADCGDIKVGKIKDIKAKADYGNVDIDTILNKCELDLSCGNVKIDKLEIKENSSIENDYGNIKINEKNDIYIDAEVDLGNKKIDNNNRYAEITLKVKADCGNIKVGE